ncbi:MAG TPA: hypothetical protein VL172_17145 [Kofleriaceae bacterium]|jgi:hypothetical protein|nr:hypothetical protein [Kofleriaceae bacterium]
MIFRLPSILALFLAAAACGPKPAAKAPPPADKTEPADTNAMGGDNVDRLCSMYADAKAEEEGGGEDGPPKADPEVLSECKDSLGKRTALERQQIAECVNSCGASDGVISCLDDFGTPKFDAACGNDSAGDDDGDDSGDDSGDDGGDDPDDDGDDQ